LKIISLGFDTTVFSLNCVWNLITRDNEMKLGALFYFISFVQMIYILFEFNINHKLDKYYLN